MITHVEEGDRLTRPAPADPIRRGEETGPTVPKVERPEGGNELLRRMRNVDPDQAKKYRQRSGE